MPNILTKRSLTRDKKLYKLYFSSSATEPGRRGGLNQIAEATARRPCVILRPVATGTPKPTLLMTHTTIRPATPADVPFLKLVIEATDLFPASMLDEMMASYFNDPQSQQVWLTDEEKGQPVAVAYFAPERLTEGTWNLYLIAVRPDQQGRGRGAALMRYVEQELIRRGERLLVVETSGVAEFEYQRAFYRKCGYEQEARIRDFYAAGNDKVIFRKSLTSQHP